MAGDHRLNESSLDEEDDRDVEDLDDENDEDDDEDDEDGDQDETNFSDENTDDEDDNDDLADEDDEGDEDEDNDDDKDPDDENDDDDNENNHENEHENNDFDHEDGAHGGGDRGHDGENRDGGGYESQEDGGRMGYRADGKREGEDEHDLGDEHGAEHGHGVEHEEGREDAMHGASNAQNDHEHEHNHEEIDLAANEHDQNPENDQEDDHDDLQETFLSEMDMSDNQNFQHSSDYENLDDENNDVFGDSESGSSDKDLEYYGNSNYDYSEMNELMSYNRSRSDSPDSYQNDQHGDRSESQGGEDYIALGQFTADDSISSASRSYFYTSDSSETTLISFSDDQNIYEENSDLIIGAGYEYDSMSRQYFERNNNGNQENNDWSGSDYNRPGISAQYEGHDGQFQVQLMSDENDQNFGVDFGDMDSDAYDQEDVMGTGVRTNRDRLEGESEYPSDGDMSVLAMFRVYREQE